MEMEEIVKMLIFVITLVIVVGAFVFFKGKGVGLLEGVMHVLRFGK